MQEKKEKCYKKKKYYLACEKREVEALLAKKAALQVYKEELDAEEEEILEKGWLGAEWCYGFSRTNPGSYGFGWWPAQQP